MKFIFCLSLKNGIHLELNKIRQILQSENEYIVNNN